VRALLFVLCALLASPQIASARSATFPKTALGDQSKISQQCTTPIALQPLEAHQQNVCVYVGSASESFIDPINHRDPTGRETDCKVYEQCAPSQLYSGGYDDVCDPGLTSDLDLVNLLGSEGQCQRAFEEYATNPRNEALWEVKKGLRKAANDPVNKIRGTDLLARVGCIAVDVVTGAPPVPDDASALDVAGQRRPIAMMPVGPGKGLRARVNLNSNLARSKFGLYEIRVNGKLHKIGKADLGRVTQSSGLPTRLHQQLRKLRQAFGEENVSGRVVDDLGTVTTAEAKAAETARLRAVYESTGEVPPGNQQSFNP
jgi:hypothetical protein